MSGAACASGRRVGGAPLGEEAQGVGQRPPGRGEAVREADGQFAAARVVGPVARGTCPAQEAERHHTPGGFDRLRIELLQLGEGSIGLRCHVPDLVGGNINALAKD